jgi:hypothetical protein
VSTPDIFTAARWLQDRHGLYVFAVDHPGRPECGGSHRECDGQRGKHPRGKWPRLATLSHVLIQAQLAYGPWNLGVACKSSSALVVDEDKPGAFAAFAASIGETIEPTFPSGPRKARTTTTGSPRARRSGTAAGSWPGTASTSAVAARGTADTPSDPVRYTRPECSTRRWTPPCRSGRCQAGSPRYYDRPSRRNLHAVRGIRRALSGPCEASSGSSLTRPRSATGIPVCTGHHAVSAKWYPPGGSTRRPPPGCSSTPRRAPACLRWRHAAPLHPGCAPGHFARSQAAHDREAGRDENPAADKGRTSPHARKGPVRTAQGHQVAVPAPW